MWQVLLGYLWAAELPLEISLGGKHTPHSIKVAEMVQELYECSLSCQGALCSRSLTAGTKWWRVCTWGCQQLKITCWTCGKTLKTDSDNFRGHLVISGISEPAAHAHVWTHEGVRLLPADGCHARYTSFNGPEFLTVEHCVVHILATIITFSPQLICLSSSWGNRVSSITHWMETDVWNYASVQYHLIALGLKYEISLQICPEETGMLCERRRRHTKLIWIRHSPAGGKKADSGLRR